MNKKAILGIAIVLCAGLVVYAVSGERTCLLANKDVVIGASLVGGSCCPADETGSVALASTDAAVCETSCEATADCGSVCPVEKTASIADSGCCPVEAAQRDTAQVALSSNDE